MLLKKTRQPKQKDISSEMISENRHQQIKRGQNFINKSPSGYTFDNYINKILMIILREVDKVVTSQ